MIDYGGLAHDDAVAVGEDDGFVVGQFYAVDGGDILVAVVADDGLELAIGQDGDRDLQVVATHVGVGDGQLERGLRGLRLAAHGVGTLAEHILLAGQNEASRGRALLASLSEDGPLAVLAASQQRFARARRSPPPGVAAAESAPAAALCTAGT